MKKSYRLGTHFRLTNDAIENYGQQYRGRVFRVDRICDHYVPAKDMALDPTGHPGFDPNGGSALYESDALNFAVYEWEMQRMYRTLVRIESVHDTYVEAVIPAWNLRRTIRIDRTDLPNVPINAQTRFFAYANLHASIESSQAATELGLTDFALV